MKIFSIFFETQKINLNPRKSSFQPLEHFSIKKIESLNKKHNVILVLKTFKSSSLYQTLQLDNLSLIDYQVIKCCI
jgi:hypothetical protein